MSKRDHADSLARYCTMLGLPEPTREHRFAPPRLWRFDVAWPEHRLAVEVHGGEFTGGRHVRGRGMMADAEKQRAAVLLGWRVLVFTGEDLRENMHWAVEQIKAALTGDDEQVLDRLLESRRKRKAKR